MECLEEVLDLIPIIALLIAVTIAWIWQKMDNDKSAPSPDPILECEILTYSEVEEKNFELLGISKKPNEAWLAFSIDLRKVIAIKLPADGGMQGALLKNEQCVLFSEFDSYVVNVPYHDVRRRWKEIKRAAWRTAL